MKGNSFIDNEQIKELIKLRKKRFRKREQKAELLRRNKKFRREFGGISGRLGKKFFSTGVYGLELVKEFYENNYEKVLPYPDAKIIVTDIPVEEVYDIRGSLATGYAKASEIHPEYIQPDRFFKNRYDLDIVFTYGKNPNDINVINNCKLEVLSRYIEEWINFCHRWNINCAWQGDLDSLHDFVKDIPQIVCRSEDILMAERELKFSTNETIEQLEKDLPYRYLYLKLDAWTGLKDIKKIWSRIERLQKVIFDYKAEEKANFGRDLCWYDFHKKKKLSHRKIARLWIENFPHDIDLLVLKTFKRERMREIKKELSGETSSILDNQKLLEEIMEGRLKSKFLGDFSEEKKFYTTGKTNRGRFTPPLLNTIKQAIKRMEKHIYQMRPSEYLFSLPSPDTKLSRDEIELLKSGI